MDFFFLLAQIFGVFCGIFLAFTLILAPLNSFLKGGTVLVVSAITVTNCVYFSWKFESVLLKIWHHYNWPEGFLGFFSYNWKFTLITLDFLTNPLEAASLISIVSLSAATILAKKSLSEQYFEDSPTALFVLGSPFSLVVLIASNGLLK